MILPTSGGATVFDMTNKTLSIWVYFKSGLVSPPNQVGAQIFLKGPTTPCSSNNYWYANGAFINLTPNHWIQIVFNTKAPGYVSTCPPVDLTSTVNAGLQIGGAG